MSDRFLSNPYIPTNKVTKVFADIDDNTLKNLFDKLSIKVVNVIENSSLDAPVSKHADILANYVGKSTFLVDKHQTVLCIFLENHAQKYGKIMVGEEKSPY
mgnify:CR=1 FL=1